MTDNRKTKTHTDGRIILAGWSLAIVVSVIAGLVLYAILKPPTQADLVRAENAAKFAALWGKAAPWLGGLVILAASILFMILTKYLDNRATETHARAGLFPIKALRSWGWTRIGRWILPAQSVIYHDPNRAPGSTTIYQPRFDGTIGVLQPATPDVNAAQLRITQGAQVAQTAAALASGTGTAHHPMTNQVRQQIPNINVQTDMSGRIPLLSPPPAQAQMLPIESSHIERLLREQGDLIPGAIVDEGEPTI